MNYVALLYSPSLDQFITDCMTVYSNADMSEWVGEIVYHYNTNNNVKDFYIVSITKMGD